VHGWHATLRAQKKPPVQAVTTCGGCSRRALSAVGHRLHQTRPIEMAKCGQVARRFLRLSPRNSRRHRKPYCDKPSPIIPPRSARLLKALERRVRRHGKLTP
jgi:hypothetical protein